MKKAVVILLSVLLLGVLIATGVFALDYHSKSTRSVEMMGETKTKYKMNKSADRIENIPFDKYISKEKKPKKAVVAKVSKDASGEENSKAINSAIDSLKKGGTVYIPKGEYKVSTIKLKSNITLFVSNGAKLVSLSCEENDKSSSPLEYGVIYADGAKNIKITGGGTICGNGVSYTLDAEDSSPLYALKEFNLYTRVIEARKRIRFAKDTQRNNVICLNECENVKVENIVLQESATWTFKINKCNSVEIENVVIDNNMHVANTDGIDVCGSSNVSISKCFIATGDDAIVLKSNEAAIKNVKVENCVLSSFANCFKIGTETQFDVENITVSNCSFFLPDGIVGGYAGIAIESSDGANVQNVSVDNIKMNGISSPVLVWLGDRLNYDKKEVGSVKDIVINNITATNTELPSAVTGCKHDGKIYYAENVVLSNIKATYRDTGENLDIKEAVADGSMSDYPEITRVSHRYFISHEMSEYWDLPCYGVFIRYGKNVDYLTYETQKRTCSQLDEIYVQDK